jgi:hypothetical protein
MIADKSEVTTVQDADALALKTAAFAQAIAQITGITTNN